MRDLTAIDAVLQHQIEGPAGKLLTTKGVAVCQYPPLAPNSRDIKFCLQHAHRSELYISPEDMDDGASFLLVDDQFSVLHVVAKRRQTAHPHALLLGSCDLVADAFAGDFPLELGEGEQHVQFHRYSSAVKPLRLMVSCSSVKGTRTPPRSRGISMKRGLVRAAISRASFKRSLMAL